MKQIIGIFGICLLCFTASLKSWALQIAATPEKMVQNGQYFYKIGDYEAAVQTFEEALRYKKTLNDARYWLGMSYYQLKNYDKAKTQFLKLTGLSSTNAKAYDGLGLVYTAVGNHGFEAINTIKQAIKIDSLNAEYHYHLGLAYLRLMEGSPLGEHPYLKNAHDAYGKVIELNPEHPDVYYQIGVLYEGNLIGTAAKFAIEAYRLQLDITPSHPFAKRKLGDLLSRIGIHTQAIRILSDLNTERNYTDSEVVRDLAIAYWRAKNWSGALMTFEYLFTLIRVEERALYFDLGLISETEIADLMAQSSDADRDEIWRQFWAARDSNPITEENERMIEHFARVAYARRAFGVYQYPWDRRGDITIRYGPPEAIRNFKVYKQFANSLNQRGEGGERLSFRQVWRYISLPGPKGGTLNLTFENEFNTRQYDYPPVFAWDRQKDLTIRDTESYFIARRTITATPEQHRMRELGKHFDYLVDPVIFRDNNGNIQVEVAYGMLPESLTHTDSNLTNRTLNLGLVLYDENWTRVASDSGQSPIYVTSYGVASKQVIAAHTFNTPSGGYQMTTQIHDRQGLGFSVQRSEIQIPDFTLPGLKMSGIRLASGLSPADDQPPWPRYADRLIMPNPAKTYRVGEPVHFYIEMYDLELDEEGNSHYQIEVSIRNEADDLPSHSVWRFLSKMEEVLRQEDAQSVTIVFEQKRHSEKEIWTSGIDTADMPEGTYTLSISIIDELAGSSVSNTQKFWIKGQL